MESEIEKFNDPDHIYDLDLMQRVLVKLTQKNDNIEDAIKEICKSIDNLIKAHEKALQAISVQQAHIESLERRINQE